MKIKVNKYVFVGLASQKDAFLEKAQEKGFIEFIPASKSKQVALPKDLEVFVQAQKILRYQECEHPQETVGNAKQIAERTVELSHTISGLEEEVRALDTEMARVHTFGDFSFDEIKEIEEMGDRIIQFFTMKQSKRMEQDELDTNLIYIGTDFDLDYFVSVSKDHYSHPDMIEMQIDRPLGTLKNRKSECLSELEKARIELKNLAVYQDVLADSLMSALDTYHLEFAKTQVSSELDETLFSVEAWMPSHKLTKVHELMSEFSIHCEQIAIEKDERIPTFLKNKGFSRIGEDLVNIYDVPSNEDKDPSPWVFWAFIAFFSIIVADAGYGMLYVILALFLRKKFKGAKGSGKRFLTLVSGIAVGCVAWGVLTASYFGMHLQPDNPIVHYSMLGTMARTKAEYHITQKDDVYQNWVQKFPQLEGASTGEEFINGASQPKDGSLLFPINEEFSDNILLELALFIGALHICLSLLRTCFRSWSNFGWIAFMIGAYLYLPSMLNATSLVNFMGWISKPVATTIGYQLLWIGLGSAVVLALIQLRMGGLAEITKLIQIFADTLSYLRLYALGLAGMMMAATFNGIAKDAGLIFGILIIICGHALNITMGAIGGIIHGLRLNFLEWYHYCFEGGGRYFNPLKKIKSRR